ncbi:hypothetical protein BT67DRAFT_238388 [Trichocladium antarcticum]|uniref:Uncharacterized protein n=1 Tax=Trichocladium antarcticum TaxID=1450529 RepID=A0AAN6UNI2_9PEZI|nr:hypothetical protein BT67DRAFT_238388 [Trichocladium antarcticum]
MRSEAQIVPNGYWILGKQTCLGGVFVVCFWLSLSVSAYESTTSPPTTATSSSPAAFSRPRVARGTASACRAWRARTRPASCPGQRAASRKPSRHLHQRGHPVEVLVLYCGGLQKMANHRRRS